MGMVTMKETVKTGIKGVIVLLCLMAVIMTVSGSASHGADAEEPIYIVSAIITALSALYSVYRFIKKK